MVNFTDEKHLLIDLKGGSFQAFERLYNMYSGKLYNFIMRLSSGNQYMAEEVVQSTFIRIWEVRESRYQRFIYFFSLYDSQKFTDEHVPTSDR